MKKHVKMLLLLYILILSLTSLDAVFGNKDVTIVDIVLKNLKDQSWAEHEKPCLDQTLSILNNVKNYTVWAVWIWNSMQLPVGTFYGARYNLGNYDQCLNAPSMSAYPNIVTQYCLADVILTGNKFESSDRSVLGPTEVYIGLKSNVGRIFNKISWGACLPSACKQDSTSKILKAMYLANPLTPAEPDIKVAHCDIAGQKTEYSYGFYAFIIFIVTSIGLSLLATYYLQNLNSNPEVIQTIGNAFCLKRNWSSLTKKSDGEIASLNFAKVCLTVFYVLVHKIICEIFTPISNGLSYDKVMLDTDNPLKNFMKHVDQPLDVFITISGLFLMKALMDKQMKPVVGLVNRYFRLTAPYAVVTFYVIAVSIYTGDGPFWKRFAGSEQQACVKTWWMGILMITNYVDPGNMCIISSWYILCDYQLAVMGTIFYLILKKKTTLTNILSTIIVIMAILIPGIVTYWRKLPSIVLHRDIEKNMNPRLNEVFLDPYPQGHNRAGPFLIGMAMGYIMTKYKPENYRNIISKKHSALLFALACMIVFKISTSPIEWFPLEYDPLSSALYAVYSRNLWAFATCLTLGVVEYGTAAPIRNFSNWHGFTILSRLTYGVYLTQFVVFQQNLFSRRNLRQYDLVYAELLSSFGVTMMCLILSTLLWLFVEAPVNNLVNLFTKSGSKDKSQKKD